MTLNGLDIVSIDDAVGIGVVGIGVVGIGVVGIDAVGIDAVGIDAVGIGVVERLPTMQGIRRLTTNRSRQLCLANLLMLPITGNCKVGCTQASLPL